MFDIDLWKETMEYFVFLPNLMSHVIFGTEQKNLSYSSMDVVPGMDCDQTVMDLPSVTLTVFITTKSICCCWRLRGISDMSLLPLCR
jgi:hypothetical protein